MHAFFVCVHDVSSPAASEMTQREQYARGHRIVANSGRNLPNWPSKQQQIHGSKKQPCGDPAALHEQCTMLYMCQVNRSGNLGYTKRLNIHYKRPAPAFANVLPTEADPQLGNPSISQCCDADTGFRTPDLPIHTGQV